MTTLVADLPQVERKLSVLGTSGYLLVHPRFVHRLPDQRLPVRQTRPSLLLHAVCHLCRFTSGIYTHIPITR